MRMPIGILLLLLVLESACSYASKKQSATPSPLRATASRGEEYMVATQGVRSSKIGRDIFALGGNVIDVAVAVSLALGVERPQSTGIGGGGFLLFYNAREQTVQAIDFRESAPSGVREKMYLDERGRVIPKLSVHGPLSVATPGLVRGLYQTHLRYGKLTWDKVVAPSIALAERGFPVYPHLAKAIALKESLLKKYHPQKLPFFDVNGSPLSVGAILHQPELAQTLRLIQEQGDKAFYSGEIAHRIIATQKKYGGIIEGNDLINYTYRIRDAIWGKWHNYKVASMPLPSAGGVQIIQMLNVLSTYPLEQWGRNNAQTIHITASAMQLSFADRTRYLGDRDFVSVPVVRLTSNSYARELRSKINPHFATPSSHIYPLEDIHSDESTQTTHFTIMDREGNTVTSTQTINTLFGSGVVVEGTGIVLNNQMDDFSSNPGVANTYGAIGGKANKIVALKRPLSSMSPTIVFDGKSHKPVLALGSPGGTKIISCVLHTILNRLLYRMPLPQAMSALRYHHQWWPDQIRVEYPSFSSQVASNLHQRGYRLKEKDLYCKVNAIERKRLSGQLVGVVDPRGEGLAIGQ